MLNKGLSKDCWTIVGTHCDFVSKLMIASSCLRLRDIFYRRFDLDKWIKIILNSDLNRGLQQAANKGRRDLVNLFISKGANEWNLGLRYAAAGGHRDLVDLFISKGATHWNNALYHATLCGHHDLVNFFISKGATPL